MRNIGKERGRRRRNIWEDRREKKRKGCGRMEGEEARGRVRKRHSVDCEG